MSQGVRIAYIAAGAGGMYCGSCLHDNTLAAALLAEGEDILLVPTYTPIRTDEHNVSVDRVFFGGINVYLQQLLAPFRHTPWFLDRLLDGPRLLGWAGRQAGSTRAEDLGPLTVSMLRGEAGHQRKELEKLVFWLKREVHPQVVHLSNALLLGMARQIRSELKVPVVCTLSGEDIFLERLPKPHYQRARDLMIDRARDIAGFVALNGYYADYMANYLQVSRDKIEIVPHGLNLAGHGTRRERASSEPLVIGYLARICPEKGLHLLIEAFQHLRRLPDCPPLRLRAAGYLGPQDEPYLARLEARVAELGMNDEFEYVGELDRTAKIAFLQSLDVMSVPTVYRESKGLSIIEAWANAVPTVLPAHGAFPEMTEDTQGGTLHAPDDPVALADALGKMILNPEWAGECGRRGQAAVRDRYNDRVMAQRHAALYHRLIGGPAVETLQRALPEGTRPGAIGQRRA